MLLTERILITVNSLEAYLLHPLKIENLMLEIIAVVITGKFKNNLLITGITKVNENI